MSAEIIAIGSELTTGAKLDTNSQWLSLELSELGISVKYHQTMADDLPAMVEVFRAAALRSDWVIITGGLGPTLDDLTREALAELAGVELGLHQESLDIIRGMFQKRNRDMPERNVAQAMFPQGSEPIPNRRGTAPGIWIEFPREGKSPCRIAALPGVPSEMKLMFREQVLPRMSGSGRVIRRARINCFGVGESDAEQRLGDVTVRGRDPEVGITAHEATITLRITAEGETAEECRQKIAETTAIIHDRMGLLVFGEEDEELQHTVVKMLKERGLTLGTAESGTGGLLAHWLTDVADFEPVYLGGIIAPTLPAKRNLLGVSEDTLSTFGPISGNSAAEMAQGARRELHTDFALAITEYPRLEESNTSNEIPRSWIALCGENISKTVEHILIGDPAIAKSRAAKTALNLLRLHLLRGN
jgi:nicotinamide-nucleotide amidase